MPQFIMPLNSIEETRAFNALTLFQQGYVEAMFFTDCNSDSHDELGDMSFGDLTADGLETIKRDCDVFYSEAESTLAMCEASPEQAGRDFWYTRNGHGTGFWDRDDSIYPVDCRDKLDHMAKAYGEAYTLNYFAPSNAEPDYESAAKAAGWSRVAHSGMFNGPIGSATRLADYESWQELCEDNNISA